MKNLMLVVLGIAGGFVIAHKVNQSARGRAFFSEIDARLREFTDTVADAYHAREAELRETIDSLVDEAESTIDDLKR